MLPSFGNGPAAGTHSLRGVDASTMTMTTMRTTMIAPTPQMADSILAESLNQMSLQERERVYEDVHGVAPQSNPEEPSFVMTCLTQLQTELEHIPSPLKQAYNLAYSQNAIYVTHSKFRLLFLRSEAFQPKAAAYKMVGFLEAKLELFGPDKLSRDIVLSDYDASDIKCLESGLYQLLPGRDRSGRAVLFCNNAVAPPNATVVNKVRGSSRERTVWWREEKKRVWVVLSFLGLFFLLLLLLFLVAHHLLDHTPTPFFYSTIFYTILCTI
jgi:hypothetical protein